MRALPPIAHTNPSLSFRRDGLLLPWYNSRHGAMFHAVAAVEAVLLVDDAGRAQGDGPLGAGLHTGAAADAVLGNGVALGLCPPLADCVALPEDGIHPQVEVLDGHVPDAKHHANAPSLPRVHIGEIGLLRKNQIPPLFLLFGRHGRGRSGEANHLFIAGVAQY